jgi:hypothetical protein
MSRDSRSGQGTSANGARPTVVSGVGEQPGERVERYGTTHHLQDVTPQDPVIVNAAQRTPYAGQKGVTRHPISVEMPPPGENPKNLGCSACSTQATLRS